MGNEPVQTGLRWAFIRQLVTGLAGTIGAALYTRFLTQEDLGLYNIAYLVFSALVLLVQAPIRDAIIYFQDDEQDTTNAALWMLLSFSGVSVLAVWVLATPYANLFNAPEAAPLTRLMGGAFLFQSLAVVPSSLLLKRFRYARREIYLTLFGLVLLVGWGYLAANGYGARALVIPQIVGAALYAAACWLSVSFIPQIPRSREPFQRVFGFSRHIFGSRLLTYLKFNVDNAAVGTLGASSLGAYSLGEDQSSFAKIGVGQPIAQIALPAMAAVQDNIAAVREIYLRMLRLASVVSAPLHAGAFVLADLGMVTIFGEQWLPAVPVLRAYLVFHATDTLLQLTDAITSAIGRPDIRLRIDAIQLPFFIVTAIGAVTLNGTIAGVAWVLTCLRIGAAVWYFGRTMIVTQMRAQTTWRYIGPSHAAAVLMGGIVALAQPHVAVGLPVVQLLLLIMIGGVAYGMLLFTFDRYGLFEVLVEAVDILLPDNLKHGMLTIVRRKNGR